jgi:flagellar M-ring protein FliF
MQAAMQNAGGMDQMPGDERRAVILPPQTTSRERDQAIATVDQRPDAAIKVTRNWLRS